MAEEKKNPLGPTGEQVRANIARIRESRGMTKKQLADRTAELGRPIPPLGVSRVEAGTRRVDVDDLVALAIALRVSPTALLLPWTERPDDVVEVTASGAVQASIAWLWADGHVPMVTSGSDPWGDRDRFELDSRPAWARDVQSLAVKHRQVGEGRWDPQSGLHEWYVKLPESGGGEEPEHG
ncbi:MULTISPECIES: helix-turn-helix domain-containing protein [Streptomyces]|uniref:XRE family transcriptional regulator n=1 Tax=Streptomyces dengpaensis TaxID=2049881 RepID=A0ABN5I983_9ACTN|nr:MULTISPECIES: helix-turn-helix transcriptional regulator [Streptomyces]AVH59731.1 XRE family transcriptional regulator [Streptomyces dengpaensis]PIB09375.1 transcriptional regulator [Streptomyces sp. HG99]